VTAALAQLPSTLDELLHLLGNACAMCGEETVREQEDDGWVASCPSCGSVLEEPQAAPRGRLRLVM
jgi:uncharacterized Zn finger protein